MFFGLSKFWIALRDQAGRSNTLCTLLWIYCPATEKWHFKNTLLKYLTPLEVVSLFQWSHHTCPHYKKDLHTWNISWGAAKMICLSRSSRLFFLLSSVLCCWPALNTFVHLYFSLHNTWLTPQRIYSGSLFFFLKHPLSVRRIDGVNDGTNFWPQSVLEII